MASRMNRGRLGRGPGGSVAGALALAVVAVGLALAPGRATAAVDPDDVTPDVKPTDAGKTTETTKPAETKPTETKADAKAEPKEAKPAEGDAKKATDAAKPADTAKPAEASKVDELMGESAGRHGLSWDAMFAGVPSEGAIAQFELGFSGLPRVAYHYALTPDLSLGAMASFDFAYWAPERAFSSSLLFQAPIRIALLRQSTMAVGLRLDPGVAFLFDPQLTIGVLLNAGGTIGWTIEDRLIVGGGIDVPLSIWVPTKAGDAFVTFPLLFGPVAEFHVTPPLALTFDFKVGPHITAASIGGGTTFGLRMMAGVAYRL